MTDPRLGLPSASNSERYAHCLGSFQAGRGMAETSTSDSELGDRGHHALACYYRGGFSNEPLNALPEAERETCDRCIQGVNTVLGDLDAMYSTTVAMVERRLWLTHEGKRVGSGQADLVVMLLNQPAYVIFDFKLLYGQTSPAESNWQLRSLAALLRETLGDDKSTIYASIVAPNQSRLPSVVRYDYDASMVALRATVDLFRSVLAGGPRTPGDHCRYCPALGNCPEAMHMAVDITQRHPSITSKDAATIPAHMLGMFLEYIPIAEQVIAAAKAEAARRLNLDPESVPGFRLRPGVWKETISKPEEVFARFVAKGGTSESFMPTVSVAKGALKDALRGITGLKGEALDVALKELLAGCVERSQNKASLERTKA